MTEHNEVEYVCECGAERVGLSAFTWHAKLRHDYENVSEAVRQCDELREVDAA